MKIHLTYHLLQNYNIKLFSLLFSKIRYLMKKILLFILLLQNLIIAQNKEVLLPPSTGDSVKYSNRSITRFFSVYVNKDKEVFFENIKTPIEFLSDTILKYRNKIKETEVVFLQIHLLADKRLDYSFIQRVKSQFTKVNSLLINYRTGDINSIESGFFCRLNNQYINRERNLEKEITLNEFYKEIKISRDPIYKMIDLLYSLAFEEAKIIMDKNRFLHFDLKTKDSLIINDVNLELGELHKKYKMFKNIDFIFLTIDNNLKYESYLKYLSTFSKYNKQLEAPIGFIEISDELRELIGKNNIKLFNVDLDNKID